MAKAKNSNQTRVIYDKNFYLAQTIINSQKYIVQKNILKEKLRKLTNGGKRRHVYYHCTRAKD